MKSFLPIASTRCAPPIGRSFSLCTTSVDNVKDYHKIDVFPNPVLYNKININFELDKSSDITFQIFDVSGRLISTEHKGKYGSGNFTDQLHISENLPSGLYLLVVQIGQSMSTFKIQKHN